MLVAAAVCPHTPLLVPALAGAGQGELDDLRSACHEAVAALRSAGPDRLVVVGGAAAGGTFDGWAAGSLRAYGVDVTTGAGEPVLPLSLTVGRWLLERAAYDFGAVRLRAVASGAEPDECLALGAELAGDGRVAMLVMADGSACLTAKSPGHHDPAAGPYDDQVAGALAGGDHEALAALDPGKADRLWAGGRAALQVLAGAAAGGGFGGRLLARAAPYGVGYFTAVWERRGAAPGSS
ncbi:hypothetical protein [Nonomuraea sp. SBT364]|uniref:hypothetical protein n=1 Tax=Nonomuraea sp. SBT364 TaxID=1580530 RepID=UPI00066DEFBB|nr:hypothetical protein [Nonomuraea sp. SBT364]